MGVNVDLGDYRTRFTFAVSGEHGSGVMEEVIASVHNRHLVMPVSNTLGELERLRAPYAIRK